MGPFQSSAEGLGPQLTEHSKCWYHVIGHNSKAIWRFVKKIYGIYRHPLPSPFPSLPSSSFAFIAFHLSVTSSLTSSTPTQSLGNPKVALCLSAHLVGTLEELSQPSLLPRPQPVPPFFLGPHLGNQFPLLVHADVEACLSSSYSNPAPEGVCLHDELCCQERLGWGGGGYWQLPDLQCSMSLPQLAHPRSSCSKPDAQAVGSSR